MARRYARNLANARWLWRNRTIASDIQVSVAKTNSEGSQSLIANFNALKISKIDFDKYHAYGSEDKLEICYLYASYSSLSPVVQARAISRTLHAFEVFTSLKLYIEQKLESA